VLALEVAYSDMRRKAVALPARPAIPVPRSASSNRGASQTD